VITTTAEGTAAGIIRWHYLWYAAAAIAVMIVVIVSHDRWLMNFVHVFSGVLWTGIDLFMGFIVGPVLRRVPISARREVLLRLVPRTLFLMPTLAILTGTTGWYLAVDLGYLQVQWPEFAWVAAALALLGFLTVQGTGYLLPTNLRVCFELAKPNPDAAKIARLMKSFFFVVAMQGAMQVMMIVIMARFVTGL
jgi:hypothetical protein